MSETLHDGGHGHTHSNHSGGLFGHDHSDMGGHGDHHAHANHHHHHVGELSQNPQGSMSWSSALRGLKMEHMLQGITITPNMLLFFLFAGFTAWLWVVYFVRHHEPLANQVLGTGAAQSATAHADRRMIAGMHKAMPIRTGPTTGMVFVPNSPPVAPAPALPSGFPAHNPAQLVPQAGAGASLSVAPGELTARNAYHVPVTTADGVRLKTVVNR